jgi:hypothetical protein
VAFCDVMPSSLQGARACQRCDRRVATFHVKPAKRGGANAAAPSQLLGAATSGFVPAAAADGTRLRLWLQDGSIAELHHSGLSTELNISMRWYNASDGADGAIASGAYIFR